MAMPMQTYSASEAARMLGISLDTLRRWDRAGRIVVERDEANRRRVPAAEVRRLRGESSGGTSARNRIGGVVRAVEIDGLMARIEFEVVGPARLVAMITSEAARELDLEPGLPAEAVIKSTSIMLRRD